MNYISLNERALAMARREVGKENVRKLQRTGENGDSYAVTLPKEYIEKLDWKK